jgi:glycosyltransferase involved in cell wall biosynthesis
MNIAFFSKHLPSDEPNGVSVQVHRLAEALTHRGHTVTVFTFSPPVQHASYRCITLPAPTLPRILRKFAPAIAFRSVNTTPFDIVHYHGDDYLCHGSPHRVRTFYGSALREALHAGSIGRFIYQSLFYGFEWVSCLKRGRCAVISEDTRRSLPLARHHLPCCIPLGSFTPGTGKTPQPSILFLGDFNSRKRGALLLDVFTGTILPAHPDCTLTVIGPVPCSGKNIRYAGRPDEAGLIELYREHWILCFPSSYEGFGVPVLEAMACGTPVAATHNPGSDALITHGENGLLCTPATLGASLLDLIDNKEKRDSLAAGGLRTAAGYDARLIAEQCERLYALPNRSR